MSTAGGELPPPEGFTIGHWTDAVAETGCTVVLPPAGSTCGVDVRGGGPGSRETEILGPLANASEATAVLLTGGSAFGLAAADGVVRWCEENGRGYATPGGLVPLVPAAVIYDLITGRPDVRPGPEQGYEAAASATGGVPERGRVGAATGAAVAKALGREHASPGGIGYAALTLGSGETVAAIAAVNATGDIIDVDGSAIAELPEAAGEHRRSADLIASISAAPEWSTRAPREGTTLVCVMTDLPLDKLAANKVARMASAGIARAVDPVFTPFDGDITFCLASGGAETAPAWRVMAGGTAAATVTAAAIRDGARSAAA